jgi:AcrR family transcriptional regulator
VAGDATARTPEGDRPLRADAARNRERVLEAARAVFAERGVEATLDDVARRAGVGVGTVYRRFADKDELLDALFHERIDELVAIAEDAAALDDPWGGLVRFMEQGLDMHAVDRGLREVVFDGRRGGERLAAARARIAPLIVRLVARAQAAGQLRADAAVTDVPMVQLMLFGLVDATGEASPDLWRRYLAIVLDGLRARPGDETPLEVQPLALDQVGDVMHRSGARRGRPPG